MGAAASLGPLLTAVATRRVATRPRLDLPLGTVLVYAALLLGAGVMLYPFAYMLSTSLKSPAQVYLFPRAGSPLR